MPERARPPLRADELLAQLRRREAVASPDEAEVEIQLGMAVGGHADGEIRDAGDGVVSVAMRNVRLGVHTFRL